MLWRHCTSKKVAKVAQFIKDQGNMVTSSNLLGRLYVEASTKRETTSSAHSTDPYLKMITQHNLLGGFDERK